MLCIQLGKHFSEMFIYVLHRWDETLSVVPTQRVQQKSPGTQGNEVDGFPVHYPDKIPQEESDSSPVTNNIHKMMLVTLTNCCSTTIKECKNRFS